MTSNMIYIVALGDGFKCPRKIHLSTQSGRGGKSGNFCLLLVLKIGLLREDTVCSNGFYVDISN